MSDDSTSCEELLLARLNEAEETLAAIRRGEIDMVLGYREPLIVQFISLAEEKERLKNLLDIVRRVSQLILHVDDPQRLLQSSVKCLGGSGLFNAACILQVDADEKTDRLAEYGWGEAFDVQGGGMTADDAPRCITAAIGAPGPMVIADRQPVCGKCRAVGCLDGRCVIGVPMTHGEACYGAFLISAPRSMERDTDVHRFCEEIGGELGFAFYRMRAELETRRLAQAIDQVGDMIVVTDLDGTIEYVNPAFESITGYTKHEVKGRNMLRLLESGRHDEAFYREMLATISAGRIWQGRMVSRRRDGSLYTEDAIISPVRDTDGSTICYMAIKRDVTEHLRLYREKFNLEEQLRQAQKIEAIGRLAGGVAHDFNNMLSIIIGYGENILNKLQHGDPLREDVDEIVKAGRRSATLTRQLLAFSRRQTLQPEVLDLNALVRDLEKMLRRLIGEDIRLEMSLAGDLACVEVDPGQIEQIVMNLVLNARDAMPAGGKIIIETAGVELDDMYARKHVSITPGKYVMLAVTDNGCGMDRETMAQIFDPFFTTKEEGKGTGLGLSTVYGIVKQSGGNIWAYSEPGQGTTFKIYLPQTPAEPVVKESEAEWEETRGSGEHILVVEDEEALRKLVRTVLLRLGYRVTVAANGAQALHMVEAKGLKPDMVITDVVMPGMRGPVMVERLRKKQPGLKALYMSGYTNNAIVHHGVLDPEMPFIQKPCTIRDIAVKVRDLLRSGAAG